jgi:FAD-dependent urate hydroxylase
VFRRLPEFWRRHWNDTLLDSIGGYFIKDRFLDRVPFKIGRIERAEAVNDRVRLLTRAVDGSCATLETDHLVAATGYKGDLRRLGFLSDKVKASVRTVEHQPLLSANFESSVPGLYFTGWMAVCSFGLVMRHVCGTSHLSP